MRPSSGEVAAALYGVWRLMRFDSNAMNYFDKSVDGFWKSFYAAVFWIPVSTGLSFMIAAKVPGSQFNILSDATANIAYLFVFPFALHGVCTAMGWQKNYIACVVALNWTRIFHVVVSIPLVLAVTEGIDVVALEPQDVDPASPPIALALMLLVLTVYLLAFEVFVFSRSLTISIPAGISMVFVEFFITVVWVLITLIITNVASAITGGASG